MALDRGSPVLYARVGNAGSQALNRIPAEVRVISMTFDDEEAKADILTLDIDNHDLANFDTPLFAIGNTIEVCWGYPGAMAKARTCVITKIKGSTKLKVTCKGKAGHVANLVVAIRTFENMRRSDIAAILAEEAGLTATSFIQQTPVVIEHTAQVRMTNAQFLRELAHKEGYDYYVDANGFHFHARNIGAPSGRTFTYHTDPAGGDVVSFDIDGDITAKPAVIVMTGRDPLSKENFAPYSDNQNSPGRATNAPVNMLTFAKTGAPDPAQLAKLRAQPDQAGVNVQATPAKNKDDAQARANAAQSRAEQKALKITLQCVGDALVEAKQTVTLRSFGRTLDGNYHVTSVKHVVGPGYKMTVKLTRSGVGASTGFGANGDATDGTVNKTTGPPTVDQRPFAATAANGAVTWQVGPPKP